ncbi:hypothetical protein F4782DRAFT_252824 [Xylaria castorea]|nr:hypothetical protein F4782DRAFT_252824 [Xylaria castorea]
MQPLTVVKKHITAYHCKEEARACGRCNQAYGTQDALVAHLGQCDHPPLNRPPIRYTDPEDGVDYSTETILVSRKIIDRINTWETLWKLLFPADTFVPCLEFEPVVEDHDFVYVYRCSQSQISQRLDALDLGPSAKQTKASIFEEIESLLRCGDSRDQYLTPSLNASTTQTQSRSIRRDIATVDRESGLAVDLIASAQMTGVSNTEGPRPLVKSGIQNSSGIGGFTQLSSTDVAHQPLTSYSLPVVPNNQDFVDLLPEPTQLFRATTQRTWNIPHRDSGLEALQSSTQSQPELFCAGTQFSHSMCSQIPQECPWVLNDVYSSIENDQAEVWPDFSSFYEFENINDAGC